MRDTDAEGEGYQGTSYFRGTGAGGMGRNTCGRKGRAKIVLAPSD